MFWGGRPSRNWKHPGDVTPKWAPVGRAGRIVIALTVVAGIVIALMVIGTRSGDASDDAASPAASPSSLPPPWFGGRVEMPEHGFAVTLPDDWVALDTAVDAVSQVEAASDFLDPVIWSADYAKLFDVLSTVSMEGIQLVLAHASSVDVCVLGAKRDSPEPVDDMAG